MHKPPSSPERKKVKKRVVANLAIVNRKTGKLLLHKRVKEKYEGVDYWSFFGGRCDKGETPLETVKREVYEELQLLLTDADLIYLGRTTNVKVTEKGSERIHRHVFLTFTDSDSDAFTPQEKHGEDATFFEFDEAVTQNFRNDIAPEIEAVRQSVDAIMNHLGFLLESRLYTMPLSFSL